MKDTTIKKKSIYLLVLSESIRFYNHMILGKTFQRTDVSTLNARRCLSTPTFRSVSTCVVLHKHNTFVVLPDIKLIFNFLNWNTVVIQNV